MADLQAVLDSVRTVLSATGRALAVAVNAAAGRTALGSTSVGDAVFVAVDAATARTAIGAGTSSLAIGTTAGTAADGAITTNPVYIALASYVAANQTQGNVYVGGTAFAIDSAAMARTGLTQTWTFCVNAAVSSGRTGTVILYDITSSAIAATINTITATTSTAYTAIVTLPTSPSARMYVAYMSVDGSTTAHIITHYASAIKVSYAP